MSKTLAIIFSAFRFDTIAAYEQLGGLLGKEGAILYLIFGLVVGRHPPVNTSHMLHIFLLAVPPVLPLDLHPTPAGGIDPGFPHPLYLEDLILNAVVIGNAVEDLLPLLQKLLVLVVEGRGGGLGLWLPLLLFLNGLVLAI